MQFFRALGHGVAARLAGGYALLIAMVLLVALVGLTNIGKIRSTYDKVLDERIPRITAVQKIQANLSNLNADARDALLTTDNEQRAKIFALLDMGRAQVGEELEALQKALEQEGTAEATDVAQKIGNGASGVLVGLVKFSRYVKADKREQALVVLQESIQPQLKQLSAHITGYEQQQISSLASVKEEVAAKERLVVRQNIALLALSLLIAVSFAWWLVRSVVAPLRAITSAAGYMAKGDFSRKLTAQRDDEVGQVVEALNQTSSGLTSLVGNIRDSVGEVNNVAERITHRNGQVETSAKEQTQALDIARKFIGEVQQVIGDNVSIANQATGRANDMSAIAVRSSASVTDAVHEMQMINQSSQKITDIISMIDGIAFQTNILALNAAVEAARAGEQGRGFAVVASEVRSLAGRSAAASKEIKELILASQQRVVSGTAKVQSISVIMEEVIKTSEVLRDMVDEISSGSEVQSGHMAKMVQSVTTLIAGNDHNVEIVGGMRLDLQDLRETALALDDKVAEFKTT